MTPNVGLMRQVIDIIEEDPGTWNQDSLSDCFAGITLDISGYEVAGAYGVYHRVTNRKVVDENGQPMHVVTVAARLLGIDPPKNPNAIEGDHLFNSEWTFDGLQAKVTEYAAALNRKSNNVG